MSIPGVNLEDDQQAPVVADERDPVADPQEHDDDDPDVIETVTGTKGEKLVPLSALIDAKRSAKALKKQMAELEPKIARADAVGQQLDALMPDLETLRALTPDQRQMLAKGTLPTRSTPQPEDDIEARETAEDLGLIDANGALDIARARRHLDRVQKRAREEAEAANAPLRLSNAQQTAEVLKQRAKQALDKAGQPLVSAESVDQAFGLFADVPHIAADPKVTPILTLVAAGIDKLMGRSPRAAHVAREVDEPLFTESAGGRRGPAPISEADKKLMDKLGLSEKDVRSADTTLARAAGRRGIALE